MNKKLTSYEIESMINLAADDFAIENDLPADFYGDCYPDEIRALQRSASYHRFTEDDVYNEAMSIFESYK